MTAGAGACESPVLLFRVHMPAWNQKLCSCALTICINVHLLECLRLATIAEALSVS